MVTIRCLSCYGGLPLNGPEQAQKHQNCSVLHDAFLKKEREKKRKERKEKEEEAAKQWLAERNKKEKKGTKPKKLLPPVPLFR